MRAMRSIVLTVVFIYTYAVAAASPTARPTSLPTKSNKPTPRPTFKPTRQTSSPTAAKPVVTGTGWIYSNTYQDADCVSTPLAMKGDVLNACNPLYTNGGYNHTSHSIIAPQVSGYYMYSSCLPGTSASYKEFGPDNWQCNSKVSPPTLTKTINGACTRTVDPNSGDILYISNAHCIAGKSLPSAPDGSIVMLLYSSATSCVDANLVGFEATSTSYCAMADSTSSWAQMQSLSTQYVCSATGAPMEVGYLGTHCTKKSNSVLLPTKCGPVPGWKDLPQALGWQYQCMSPAINPSPSGWLTQTFYANSDCTGPVLSMEGQATGICNIGYSNDSIAVSSLMTTCDGTLTYDALDCTGQPTIGFIKQGACIPTKQDWRRGRSSGGSYKIGCTSTYEPIPTPFMGLSVTQTTYANDVCNGPANTFLKLPQDVYLATLLDPTAANAYSQLVDCSSGAPTLTTTLGDGSSFTSFTQYYDTSCAFIDPRYSTFMNAGPKAIESHHSQDLSAWNNRLSYYRSQTFSKCQVSSPPPPPAPTVILSFPDASDKTNYGGAIAGVIISLLVASLAIFGAWYYYRNYLGKSSGDNASLIRSHQGGQRGTFEGETDEIPGLRRL